MRKSYIDVMTMVQLYTKPYIFIVMTYNPNWIKIKQKLAKHDQVHNRQDLGACVFRAKVEALKKELFKK